MQLPLASPFTAALDPFEHHQITRRYSVWWEGGRICGVFIACLPELQLVRISFIPSLSKICLDAVRVVDNGEQTTPIILSQLKRDGEAMP